MDEVEEMENEKTVWKMGRGKGERLTKTLPIFGRAYEIGSQIADPRATKVLGNCMLNVVIDCS